jgi:broad-specificity NMP kinase
MDGPKLKITIAGPCAAGKTTIALLIERVLRFNGLNPTVQDADLGDDIESRQEMHGDVHLQKRKLAALVEKKTRIDIECVQTQRPAGSA